MSFSTLKGNALATYRQIREEFRAKYGEPARSSSGSIAWELGGGRSIFMFALPDVFGYAHHVDHEVERVDGPASRLYDSSTGELSKEVWCRKGYFKGNHLPSFISIEDIENEETRQASWEKLKMYQESQSRREKIETGLSKLREAIEILYSEINQETLHMLFSNELNRLNK